jgi:2-C-methyl-D-erythritol 2,4-cyclodiphosphate synthase
MMQFRVGTGFDVHPFEKGRVLKLGGVEIPHHSGLKGHSDADVLIHAVIDALLGTTALGDIGSFFPDSDPSLKNVDSTLLLEKTMRIVNDNNLRIVWLDLIVIAEEPKILPYINDIKNKLGAVIKIPASCISLKGKTTEGLGFTGKKEGIAAHAVITVQTVYEK